MTSAGPVLVALVIALTGAAREAQASAKSRLPAPQAGELRSAGQLVRGKKKGPGFRAEVRDPAGAVVATLVLGHKLEGVTLHRDALAPGQDVRLGGARTMELTATSTGPAWRPDVRIAWQLSRKHGVSRAVGTLHVGGTLWRTDTVEVSKKRATHAVEERAPGARKAKKLRSSI